jgi:type VI protein secretion system component Hcp
MNAIHARTRVSSILHVPGRPTLLLATMLATAMSLQAWAQLPIRPATTQPVATLDIDGLATASGQPSAADARRDSIDVEAYAWSTDTTAVQQHGDAIVVHGTDLPPGARPATGPGTLTITWRPDERSPAFRAALAEKRVFPRITLTLVPAQPGAHPQVATLHEATVALVRPAAQLQVLAGARSAADGDTTRTEQIAFAYKTITFNN